MMKKLFGENRDSDMKTYKKSDKEKILIKWGLRQN